MKTLYKINLWSLVIILPLLASLYFAVFGFLVEGILMFFSIVALISERRNIPKKIGLQRNILITLLVGYIFTFILVGVTSHVNLPFLILFFLGFPLLLEVFLIVILYQCTKLK